LFSFSKTEYSQKYEIFYFLYCVIHIDSRDGVFGVVTRLWEGSLGSQPSKCCSVGIGGSLPRGYSGWYMRLYSFYPPPNAMLRNEWSYTSAPSVCHHSVLTGTTLAFDLYSFTHEKLLIFLQI